MFWPDILPRHCEKRRDEAISKQTEQSYTSEGKIYLVSSLCLTRN